MSKLSSSNEFELKPTISKRTALKTEETGGISQPILFVTDCYIDNISFSYAAKSNIHGNGLFASHDIRKGTTLGALDGQVISWLHWEKIRDALTNDIKQLESYFFMEYNALDSKTLLVRPFRTKYSLINHSKLPNIKLFKYPLRVVALEDISANEEFTLDYNDEPLREGISEDDRRAFLK